MQIPFLAWVFQVIPESIALATLVMSMGTAVLPWERILRTGFVYAVGVYIVRILTFTPGVHVILLAAFLGILCTWMGKLEMKRAMIFSAISMGVLVLAEFVFMYIFITSGLISFDRLNNDVFLRIMGGYPHILLLFLLAFIINKKKISFNFLFKPKYY